MGKTENRLEALGIVLPEKVGPSPLADHVMTRQAGGFLFVAGACPLAGGKPWITGKLVKDMKHEAGYEAARIAAFHVLAAAGEALGTLDRIASVVKVTGYVACEDDFYDQYMIINGASHLFNEVLEDRGSHVSTAVGVNTLPFNVPVMLDAVFCLTPEAE